MERAVTFIEEQCNVEKPVAETLVRLFGEDQEVAYIARYKRKETGDLGCDAIRTAFEAFKHAKEMEAKIEKALKMLASRVANPAELEEKREELDECRTEGELNGVLEAYRTKKKTLPRMDELQRAAKEIIEGKQVNLAKFVGKG